VRPACQVSREGLSDSLDAGLRSALSEGDSGHATVVKFELVVSREK
jgi:hypothetical protein